MQPEGVLGRNHLRAPCVLRGMSDDDAAPTATWSAAAAARAEAALADASRRIDEAMAKAQARQAAGTAPTDEPEPTRPKRSRGEQVDEWDDEPPRTFLSDAW